MCYHVRNLLMPVSIWKSPQKEVTNTLDNSCFHNVTLCGTFCSCALFFVFAPHPFRSVNNMSIPSVVQENTPPQVIMPPSHLSPIDPRLASALKGAWRLVKEGKHRSVQGSGVGGSWGMSGWDLLPKLTATTPAGKKGFSPS